ncbi:hypothetical protein [Rhodoferax sp.]|uniref:hypothetical protein n=1 Tax=Rhodoferax sp. TaxID=50421 RepID=UPI002629ECC3|nr:hypothetical protein [Rhodoferax sp.]MDD2810589.1 hypothetical protein [Rhodoferax sp.]MDD4944043.1 hypothetical protein [Rhodoferax sp.]MDD5481001.1 hypothetical protein [Rhodoferax sp.]
MTLIAQINRTDAKLLQLGAPTQTVQAYGKSGQQRWGGFASVLIKKSHPKVACKGSPKGERRWKLDTYDDRTQVLVASWL